MPEIKFEESLKRLEDIVGELEKGDRTLEESLAMYEEGIKLSRACAKKLEAAKRKVEILVKKDTGKFELVDFEKKKSEIPGKKLKSK